MYQFVYDRWSQSEWDGLMDSFPSSNFYQSWHYAQLHSPGPLRSVSRAALFKDGQVAVMAAFRIKRLPLTGVGVADVDWGPLFRIDQDFTEDLVEFLLCVRQLYHQKRGLGVRLTPRSTLSAEKDAQLTTVMETCGFRHNPEFHSYKTPILDVHRDLTIIRKSLNQEWRHRLNVVEKLGLVLETGNSPEMFDRFYKIYQKMWAEKRFPTGVRLPVVRKIQYALPEFRRLHISIVRQGADDIGASVCAVCGDTLLYFLGATDPKLRGRVRPGYLLQWSNIVTAKEKNLRWYDLGGLPDDLSDGVARFKTRMNGTLICFPGRFECMSGKAGFAILDVTAEKSFSRLRNLFAGR